MASGLPNTDPRKGRPTTETSGKGGAETKAMMDSFDGVENAVVEQLALIAGFTEIMKNYIHGPIGEIGKINVAHGCYQKRRIAFYVVKRQS